MRLLLLLLLWNESHVTVESFEWSNFSIIHNHQCINFTLLVFYVHSVIKKHISFMQKKVSSENSNETSRSREAYKHNINSHVRITHPASSTVLHFVAIFLLGLNHHVFHRFAFFIHSHPQQSNESKKIIYGYRLKSFFTLCDESTHDKANEMKATSARFIHDDGRMEFSALWWTQNGLHNHKNV